MNTDYRGEISGIDATILCGGLGSRLKPLIADRPKGLAPVAGKPVLDILVDELVRQGIRRIVFCVGYMREQIIAHYQLRRDAGFCFSSEESPLGTGGAVLNALPLIKSDPMIILNGDSLCSIDYAKLLHFHKEKSAAATLAVAEANVRQDAGAIALTSDGTITNFIEKPSSEAPNCGYINAGVYVFQKGVFSHSGLTSPFSLERDLLPQLVLKRLCRGMIISGAVVDIGTPERYAKANSD